MNYPLPGKISADERTDRKVALLTFVTIAASLVGLWLWLAPHIRAQNHGLEFALTVVHTDHRISSRFGKVLSAQVKQEPMSSRRGSRRRDAHHLIEIDGIVQGKIEFFVLGDRDFGSAIIHYARDPSGIYGVELVEVNKSFIVNVPNKAPEPTTTSVTSPAAQEPRQP